MDHTAVRRITHGVPDGGNVVAAPLRGGKALCNLLGDKVAEDRKLGAELMVNTNQLFADVGCRSSAAKELCATCRSRENACIQE